MVPLTHVLNMGINHSIMLCGANCAFMNHWFCCFLFSAIDLVDEAAAKIKMELTSRPTDLDETNREVLKLEMERLSLKKDEDKISRERLGKLENELEGLKEKQKELTEQWEKEKTLMNRITSVKEEVSLAQIV